jgi:hypothetical protein
MNTDKVLLDKINKAVAERNAAETDLISKSKAVGLLLLEAKKLHPAKKDFEGFLRRVNGLHISRAYDLLRLAGGRTTDAELREDAAERQRKSRTKKKLNKPESVTSRTDEPKRITQTPEVSAEERRAQNAALDTESDLSIPSFLDRTSDQIAATAPTTLDNPISAAFWAATEKQRREFVSNNWIAMRDYYRTPKAA